MHSRQHTLSCATPPTMMMKPCEEQHSVTPSRNTTARRPCINKTASPLEIVFPGRDIEHYRAAEGPLREGVRHVFHDGIVGFKHIGRPPIYSAMSQDMENHIGSCTCVPRNERRSENSIFCVVNTELRSRSWID